MMTTTTAFTAMPLCLLIRTTFLLFLSTKNRNNYVHSFLMPVIVPNHVHHHHHLGSHWRPLVVHNNQKKFSPSLLLLSRHYVHQDYHHNYSFNKQSISPRRSSSSVTTLFGASSSIATITTTTTNLQQYYHSLGPIKYVGLSFVVAVFCTMILRRLLLLRSSNVRNAVKNVLWPKYYEQDPNFAEPLIPNAIRGCPMLGCNILQGSKKDGPEFFYEKASKSLNNPRIWSFFSFGSPVASIVGSESVTKIQNMEFSKLKIMGGGGGGRSSNNNTATTTTNVNTDSLFGGTNLMFEQDRMKHKFLRALVGSTMTPNSLSRLVPTIQNIATKYINQMLADDDDDDNDEGGEDQQSKPSVVKMETLCYDYTTEIVSKQILGFDDYTPKQIEELKLLIQTWLKGMYSWLSFFPFVKKYRPAYKARQVLTKKLEHQVDTIMMKQQQQQKQHEEEEKSTLLENMINAVHDDDDDASGGEDAERQQPQQSLSRDEVIQNTLLLVVAGTDNTTSTLVLLMLLLGLHPTVFEKLAKEQDEFLKSSPSSSQSLTYNQLMDGTTFPYLDAVIKEALRIGPITGGFPRKTTETIVFDGYQIPKNWFVFGNYRLSHILDPVLFNGKNYVHMDPIKGFKPERWLSSDTMPSEFLSFGAGPRYCLGVNLALLELKVFVAVLARTATFELVKGKATSSSTGEGQVEWNPATMVRRPLDGVLVRPKKRQNPPSN